MTIYFTRAREKREELLYNRKKNSTKIGFESLYENRKLWRIYQHVYGAIQQKLKWCDFVVCESLMEGERARKWNCSFCVDFMHIQFHFVIDEMKINKNSTYVRCTILPDGVNVDDGSWWLKFGAKRLKHKCYRWDFSRSLNHRREEMNVRVKKIACKKQQYQRPVNIPLPWWKMNRNRSCVFKARKSKAYKHTRTHKHTNICAEFFANKFCQLPRNYI